MIHPVVVYCNATDSEFISRCKRPSFAEERRAPPIECTMHFGVPVVPELYAMKNGSWKAVCSNSGIFDVALDKKVARAWVRGTLLMSTGVGKRGIETIPSNSLTSCIPFDISAIF